MDFHTVLALTQAHLYGTTGVMARADPTTSGADVLSIASAGQWASLRSKVVSRGLAIRFEDPRTGYLRVTVPLPDVHLFFEWPEIEAVRVDGLAGYDTRLQPQDLDTSLGFSGASEPPQAPSIPSRKATPRPMLTREAARRYPINTDEDMGVTEFRALHPSYDGRGVTIGVIESTWVVLDHPAFASARALDGTPRRKVLKYLDQPSLRREGISAPFSDWFECAGAICDVRSRMIRLPAAGRYRMADVMLDGRDLGGGRRGFMTYVVVQHADTKRLYIDTNGDFDFLNEQPLTDFNAETWTQQSVVSLTYLGGAPVKTVVTVDSDGQFVSLHPFAASHVTLTSSVAAGSDNQGNLAVGVAPNASLVFIDSGPTARLISQAIEGTIALARDSDVDLIYAALVLQTPLGTRESFDSLAFDRISEAYDKPVLVSAGNYPFALSASPAAGARAAMTVGQYVSSRTTEALFGVNRGEAAVVGSTIGPAMDGGTRPDFIAASKRTAAQPCERIRPPMNQFALPPCYTISSGTSSASPSAAGVVALLISAARQNRISPTMRQIREALIRSAKLVPGLPAHMQGVGLIDVSGAWAHIQQPSTPSSVDIEGELRHPFTPLLGSAKAMGIIWVAGPNDPETMDVTMRIRSGGAIDRFTSWNTGALAVSTPSTVLLDKSGAASVRATITAPEVGRVASSWIAFGKERGGDLLGRTLATATRPAPLAAPSFDYAWNEHVDVDTHHDMLVRVPAGATGLLVEVDLAKGDGRALIINPWSMPLFARAFWSSGPVFQTPLETPIGKFAGIVLNPAQGSWGVVSIERSGSGRSAFSDGPPERASLALRMTVFRTVCDLLAREPRNETARVRVSVRDVFAKPVNGGALVAPATIRTERFTMNSELERRPVSIDVKPGTAAMHIDARRHAGNGIMLQLFDCTLGHCIAVIQSVPGEETPALNVRQPRAGTWKIFAVPIKPLYKPAEVEVTVALASEANLRQLTPVTGAVVSENSAQTFEGDLPVADGADGLILFRTDERAKSNKEGWGVVSLCAIQNTPQSR